MLTGYFSEIFCSFQGEGALVGKRQLFVRTAGCHLRCRYCDTPGSLERTSTMAVRSHAADSTVANPVTSDQLLTVACRLVDSDGPVDGVAITGGEPLLQAEFLSEVLQSDRLPRPRLLETSGTHADRLRLLLPWIDVVSMDIKLPSNSSERPLWVEHAHCLAAARGKVYVKVLVDKRTDRREVARAAQLVRETAPDAPVFLQPITLETGDIDLDQRHLDVFFAESRRYVADVRVLPQVHKLLRIP